MKKKSTSKENDKQQNLVIDINSSFYRYEPPNLITENSKTSNYQINNLSNLSIQNTLFFPGNTKSIEKGLAIPINMLSQDYFNNHFNFDKFNSINKENSFHSDQNKQEYINPPIILGQKQQQLLISSVLKGETFDKNDKDQKTKNILRNIGNAQNQFISHSQIADKIIEQQIRNPQKFKKWIRKFQLQNFKQFQQIWGHQKHKVYVRVYKKLCRTFYIEHAIPYILNSRMKGDKTKYTHLKYLFKFLQGLDNPKQFNCFKGKY